MGRAQGDGRTRRRRLRRVLLPLAALAVLAVAAGSAAGCSPLYVLRAGWAEMQILRARRPIPEVIGDPATDEATRASLALALDARAFARDRLGLDVGDSYTTFTRLERDTLAMILSAAHRDRLVPVTWWFPVVGHVPYRGFFDLDDALEEQRELEGEGLDTYLRPTAAFSTLGWFSDPLLSTLLRYDDVDLVETIVHELSHNHLYLPGRTTFNESLATFIGRVGAIAFFCEPPHGVPDSVKCRRARLRWEDYVRFSRFLDGLVAELRDLYSDPAVDGEGKIERREEIFRRHLARFDAEVAPELRATSFRGFRDTPLNNATLLARIRYFHRLGDFQALLEAHGGDLRAAVAAIAAGVDEVEDPFDVLPMGEPPAPTETPAARSAPSGASSRPSVVMPPAPL